MKKGLLETMKSRGYWRINFQPLSLGKQIPSLGECMEIIEKNVVQLRGWDYPHFPRRLDEDHGLQPGDKYYEAWTEWGAHKEYWRMYQSSQFIHYLALREDWGQEDPFYSSDPRWVRTPGSSLSIIGTIYQITEICEFLSRLEKSGLYDEGVRLVLSLNNTAQRALWLNDPERAPLMRDYRTGADRIQIEEEYHKDVIAFKSKETAFNIIVAIFDRFGWHKPNKETIKTEQENLLSKRLR
jgi:hypothetical protein